MRRSGYAMVAGLLLLIYALPALRHLPHDAPLPPWLMGLAVLGGLGLLGGLFSLVLALFFHMWHKSKGYD